jgi:hypothetical protein
MSVRKINFYLDALSLAPDHRKLFANMQKLSSLQQVFFEIAPRQLAQFCTVGAFSEGNLTIRAANGAIATKIRQMVPSLLRKFEARGYEVTSIRIAVQADCNSVTERDLLAASRTAKRRIARTGLENLAQLANSLPEPASRSPSVSPLKNALIALLETQAGTNKASE